MYCNNLICTVRKVPGYFYQDIIREVDGHFLTLKHNTMQCLIQSTGEKLFQESLLNVSQNLKKAPFNNEGRME